MTPSVEQVDGDALGALFVDAPTRSVAAGEHLFRRGEPASHLYLVETGRPVMLRHSRAGDGILIHTGRPGELFAEGALFSDAYGCDAVAADGPALVRACPKAVVLERARGTPALLFDLLARVTRQLHQARAMLELRGMRSAEERVLRHVQSLAREDGSLTLDRPLVQVAADLGLTHEAYYRALAGLTARFEMLRRSA